jgi:hypothetical protein
MEMSGVLVGTSKISSKQVFRPACESRMVTEQQPDVSNDIIYVVYTSLLREAPCSPGHYHYRTIFSEESGKQQPSFQTDCSREVRLKHLSF